MPIMRRRLSSPLWLPCAISVSIISCVFQALHGYLLLKLHQEPASGEGCRAARAGRASPAGRLPVRRLHNLSYREFGKIRGDPGDFRSRCPGEIGFIIGNIIPERSSGTEFETKCKFLPCRFRQFVHVFATLEQSANVSQTRRQ